MSPDGEANSGASVLAPAISQSDKSWRVQETSACLFLCVGDGSDGT